MSTASISAKPEETVIKGADGQDHLYSTEPFGFDESVALQLELGRILGGVGGPVVEFVSSLFTVDESGIQMDRSGESDKGIARHLGEAVKAIPEGIMQAGGVAFVKRLLANTSREVDVRGDGSGLVMTRLTADGGIWLDHVYRRNMPEMYAALLWILKVNFSPFGPEKSAELRMLWQAAMAQMPQLSSLITETQQPSPDGD